MNISNLLKEGADANISLTISANDLRTVFADVIREERERISKESNTMQIAAESTLTRNEVAARLHVNKTTLWKWNRSGYLKTIKVGSKVFYKESDVNALLKINN